MRGAVAKPCDFNGHAPCFQSGGVRSGTPQTLRGVGLVACFVALAGASPATADGPSQNVDTYSLLAGRKLLAKGLHLQNGNVGVNAGSLVSRVVLDAPYSEVVAARVKLGRGSHCLALFANRAKPSPTVCGPAAVAFAGPIVPDLAAACRFPSPFPACNKAQKVDVPAGSTKTLTPGVYGDVGSKRAPYAGALVLSGRGSYVFCNFYADASASLTVQDPADVDVAGVANFGGVTFAGVAGPGQGVAPQRRVAADDPPAEFRVFVQGRKVRMLGTASIHHFCAPRAVMQLARTANVEGSFVAQVIDAQSVNNMSGAISKEPRCGDGQVDAGEECDDGNNTSRDGCEGDCTLPVCGNGILDPGEQCDDGNLTNGDGCEHNCTLGSKTCGNGVVDAYEQCDNGASNSDIVSNACRTNCKLPFCGDNVIDAGEQCDDGNLIANDGCEPSCTVTPGVPVKTKDLGTVAKRTSSKEATTVLTTTAAAPAHADVIVAFAMDPQPDTNPTSIKATDPANNLYVIEERNDFGSSPTSGARVVVFRAHDVAPLPASSPITIIHPAAVGRAASASAFVNVNGYVTSQKAGNASSLVSTGNVQGLGAGPYLLVGAVAVDATVTTSFTADAPLGFSSLLGAGGSSSGSVSVYPYYKVVRNTPTLALSGSLSSSKRWSALLIAYH